MFRNFFILVFLLTATLLAGQGWERVYYGIGQDEAHGLARTPDGGYILCGDYNAAGRLYLIKVDADGQRQYSHDLPGTIQASAKDVVVTQDGGYVVVGYVKQTALSSRDIYLLKTDAAGNILWSRSFGNTNDDEGTALIELPDGTLALTGFITNPGNDKEDITVIKTDAAGNLIWQNTYGELDASEKGFGITRASNGDLLIAGEYLPNNLQDKDAYVIRIDENGNLLWGQTFGTIADDIARDIVSAGNNNFVIAGFTGSVADGGGLIMEIDGSHAITLPFWVEVFPKTDFFGLDNDGNGGYFVSGLRTITPAVVDLYAMRTDASGNKVWDVTVGKAGLDIGNDIIATPDGGAAAVGATEPFVGPLAEKHPYLIKIDAEGQVFTSYLQGNVFVDLNGNCIAEPGESGLEDWIVKIEAGNFDRYVAADLDGNFELAVDTGTYQIRIVTPNDYWKPCDESLMVSVPAFYDTVAFNIPIRSEFSCTRNEVDVASSLLRRCTDNTYTVRCCNSGTVPSVNTTVEVEFDEYLSVSSSSIPWFDQQGQRYSFSIGTLNPGECRTFTVTAFLDCATDAGQTHCVKAHIFPDTFCNVSPLWDGAIVIAEAICEDGEIRMRLRNEGAGDMQTELNFVIAEDIIMLTAPNDPLYTFRLDAGEVNTVWTTAANGSTYRIIAEQSPGYPGVSYPTAAVEGCLSDTASGPISTGFYTMFPEDDADAFRAADCQESVDSDVNPNTLKRGHPKGYDVARYVNPQTDLDFLIRFNNSGNTTVQQVIVRDTLPAELDPTTVYPGAASHNYDFQVYGNGIVQFTIPNAGLQPGGGSASEGFVSFRVSQYPDVPCGSEILNTAAIYFDFEKPQISNQTLHTVCDSFLIIKTQEVYLPNTAVKVYPNPFLLSAQFEVSGVNAADYRLELYDMQGRLIFSNNYNFPSFRLYRHQIPTGAYMYRLVADGKPVASGKIIAAPGN